MATIYFLAAFGVVALCGIVWGGIKLHQMESQPQ